MALTAAGMALCVAFAVGSFSVVEGLERSTYEPGGALRDSDLLVARPGLKPFVPPADLGNHTKVWAAELELANGTRLQLVAFEGAKAPRVDPTMLRPGVDARLAVSTTFGDGTTLARGPPLRSSLVPTTWVVVAPDTLRSLDPASLADGRVTYVLVHEWNEAGRDALAAQGLLAEPAPGVMAFFEGGAREIAFDLLLVVAFSALLVGLMAYEFLHLEIREKRREVGLWRALGLRTRDVLTLLMVRALLVALAALVLGTTLALGGVYALGRATGAEVLQPELSGGVAFALALTFVGAAALGALLPARQAARGSVAWALEAAP